MALSERWCDMDVDGREADDIWTLGIGILERLGGRGGWRPLGVWRPETDCVGESARENELSSHSSADSEGEVDIERQCDGVGIWLGVLGRGCMDEDVLVLSP